MLATRISARRPHEADGVTDMRQLQLTAMVAGLWALAPSTQTTAPRTLWPAWRAGGLPDLPVRQYARTGLGDRRAGVGVRYAFLAGSAESGHRADLSARLTTVIEALLHAA
jgi:hypothetical protein